MSSFLLIPRVRVNYTSLDLLKSIFVSDRKRKYQQACESFISDFFDGRPTWLVSSGRGAIYHILKALPQRKVIVPAYTCMVVGEAANFAGKEIVYVGCDSDSFNMRVPDCLDSDTIVIATHQYGLGCDIEMIAEKCRKAGALLIEDCAASMGSTIGGRKAGTFGDYAIVSFNSTKLLNVPTKGGVVIAKDEKALGLVKSSSVLKLPDLSFKLKHLFRGLVYCLIKNKILYRIYHFIAMDMRGRCQRSEHDKFSDKMDDSYTYGFSEWQSKILLRQLKIIDTIIEKRKKVYEFYQEKISNPVIKKPLSNIDSVFCRYPILVTEKIDFYHRCLKSGVDLDFSHSFLSCPDSFTEEHKMASQVLNLPFDFSVSEKELSKIVTVINSI